MTAAISPAVPERTGPALRSNLIGRFWLVAALLTMIAVFGSLRPEMLEPGNVATILRSFAIMATMTLGLTWVMAAGKIDVSFMQVAALSNMIAAALLAAGHGWGVASAAGLGAGLIAGAVNGLLIAGLGLPPLIVTIATGGICASIAAALGKGTSIRIAEHGLLTDLLTTNIGPFPLVLFGVLLVYAIAWVFQERLTFGHYMYAIAQSEEAVIEAGISSRRLLIMLFVLTGGLSALAGLFLAASLSSGQPMIGASYFINGLTAVLLGGMMIHIGKPNIIGTAVAILFLAVLASGAALLGWADWKRQIIQGALLLIGIAVAVRANRKKGGHHAEAGL
ncbi:MAG: ABC transporter permease [Rhodobacteraceae bacterium]|nr:ABC transporter permease [Paracoccaceae bacterium]